MAATNPKRLDGCRSRSRTGAGSVCWEFPTVVDRVIQQAIAQVLTPIFDPGFSDSSFGFRPERSAHGALRRVQTYIGEGYRIAVDLDLAKFFDNVRHDVLMARVGRKVRDKRLLALIGKVPACGRFGWTDPSGNGDRYAAGRTAYATYDLA